LVDPAYKLEKLKEAHEKLYAMHEAYKVKISMKLGLTLKNQSKSLIESLIK
jgi:hypothetical protein